MLKVYSGKCRITKSNISDLFNFASHIVQDLPLAVPRLSMQRPIKVL